MSSNQAQMNAVLRKSLIGEHLNTQFYLFSTRSKREGNITKLQPLFADDEVLVASSEYFSGLLSEESPNDPNLVEFQDHHRQGGVSLDEYDYASDSDLDEEEGKEETNGFVQDNEKSELRVKVSAEQIPQTPSIKDFNTQEVQHDTISSRRVLVMDTAFKTWQALLYYLYTNEIIFAPLRSQASPTKHSSLKEPPPCSPKSMYRLACKIKHVGLQTKALAAIRSSLTEHNVLQELSSSLTSRFPAILEVEVDILFQHIATPTVTKDFPILIQRIVGAGSTGFPHGAEILTKLHEKMLNQLVLPRGRKTKHSMF
ncbi:uncharacterized protein BJ212DRAFT_1298488 [Suillus subaureus]|uniref:BTB domain-containing protein n=1 Tax=Suillus subaureus TaxID=48587 RepID=A0A9P7EE48_9AGAM|nr:uncharacterized protein BJ212DRAFT_1298488 [Suillus subaureus]KAG1819251.1 hypothetical protein BJ212DRAFT_1298488 [Suillus subaureus]